MRFLGVLGLVATLAFGGGCAASEDEDSANGTEAFSESSLQNTAGAFAVDYGLGILSARRFVDISRRTLMEKLPEGDARHYAQCLEARRDVVKGETLSGKTWDFEGEHYYVLATELQDGNGLEDVHMLFVFSSDGVSRFQVLTWDGRKNLKIVYRGGTPCVEAPSGH